MSATSDFLLGNMGLTYTNLCYWAKVILGAKEKDLYPKDGVTELMFKLLLMDNSPSCSLLVPLGTLLTQPVFSAQIAETQIVQ